MNDPLYRSRDDRVLAGVAGGIAEHLELDPTVVRLLWLLLVPITGGLALLLYIVMAVIVPQEDQIVPIGAGWTPAAQSPNETAGAGGVPWQAPAGQPNPNSIPTASWTAPMTRAEWRAQRGVRRADRRAQRREGSGALLFGGVLVLIGMWLFLQQYVPDLDLDRFWPFALVGLGLVILAMTVTRRPHVTGPDDGPSVPNASLGSGQPDRSTR
jgi:phage shock protein PspC (stress-responsive transcriptional regulator)